MHLLVEMPPKIAPAALVNSLKGVSARWFRKTGYPEVRQILWGPHFWSPSYFVSSTGDVSLATLRRYIQKPNAGREFFPVLNDLAFFPSHEVKYSG